MPVWYVDPEQCREFSLRLYCNVSSPTEASAAFSVGASGIGSIRIEHLLCNLGMATFVARVIKSAALENRPFDAGTVALIGCPLCQGLESIFRAACSAELIVVRLLDIDLSEWLDAEELGDLTWLGFPIESARGVRVGQLTRGLYELLIECIIHAISDVGLEAARVAIVVPFVTHETQLQWVRNLISDTCGLRGVECPKIGVMVETPAAAIRAGFLGESADLFILGTNDLNSLVHGAARNESVELGPDAHLTMLKLLKLAIAEGRAANDSLRVGVCGEIARHTNLFSVFRDMGIDFVSPGVNSILRGELG